MKETAIDDTANDALYKIVDSEIKFTVNDGKIKNVIGTSDGKGEGDTENGFVSQDGSTFTFNDAIRLTGTTDIVLRKTDIAGSTEVIGAVITITNDTTGESITWVSDGEDKTVTLENGTYTMTETDIDNTKNDKSYKIIPSTITFTVNEGTVSNVQGTSDGQSQDDKDQGYVSNDGNTFTFNDAELFTEIELSKTDIAGTNEVLGARIVITKEGSNETWEWISDGQTKTFTLSDGTYTMKETGIDQTANITTYRIIDSEVVFKVKGGDVRVISGTSDGRSQADQAYGYVYNDGRTFRFNDAEDIPNITYIEITKTDIVGASEVIGARITITNDVTGDTIEWISGDSDRIVALEDGSYTMTEVSVDNELNTLSYRIVPSTVNFTVSGGTVSNVSGVSDGRSFEDKQNGFVTNDGNKFRFNDAELLTEIELSKTDIAGTTEVLGARIVITKEGSNETWEWISDGETKYFSLSDGNYTMKETGIDNSLNELSYKIVNQTVTFTVKNGMVRNVRGTSDGTTPGIENYGFVTNEGNAFNFNDAELTTVIELAKTDITGSTEVLGAQIEITNTQTGDTLTWVSGDEERFFTLSDGTYTLKETAVDNDLNELDYAIVEQTVEFEIKEGKVINITGISDGTGEHDEVDGFVTFDDETDHDYAKFTFNDAELKEIDDSSEESSEGGDESTLDSGSDSSDESGDESTDDSTPGDESSDDSTDESSSDSTPGDDSSDDSTDESSSDSTPGDNSGDESTDESGNSSGGDSDSNSEGGDTGLDESGPDDSSPGSKGGSTPGGSGSGGSSPDTGAGAAAGTAAATLVIVCAMIVIAKRKNK